MVSVEKVSSNAREFVIGIAGHPIVNTRNLEDLLYTFNEAGAWPDAVDSVSLEQAIFCWQVVERIRQCDGSLPSDCRL